MNLRQNYRLIGSVLLRWFLALSLIPLLAVSWYAYDQILQSIVKMQTTKLEERAKGDTQRIREQFNELKKDLGYWAQSPDRQDFLYQLIRARGNQSVELFVKSADYQKVDKSAPGVRMRKFLTYYENIHDVFLIDLEGNIMYSVAKEADLGTNLQDGPYASTRFAKAFRATLNDGQLHFSDIEHYGPSNNVTAGFVTAPMYTPSGKMIGVIALQLNMETFLGGFIENQSGFYGYLVGEDGLLRSQRTNPKEVLERRISSRIFWDWHDEHVMSQDYSSDMEEGATFYIGPDGNKVLGQHHNVDLMGIKWVYIREVDEGQIMAEPNHLAKTIALFVAVAALAVIMTAIMIARRITKPIRELSNASLKYMNGEKGVRVNLSADDEIGEFGGVFNRLIEKQEFDEEKLSYLAQKTQKTLEELKEQKYALDAHSIVAITDVKGTITFVNTKFEEITGYSSEELIGKNHRILNSGVHEIEFWKEMYRTVSHGAIWHGEVCNIAKDRHLYWVDTTIVPFMGENGKPESYIAIRTDITERKSIQDSFNEAMQLQKAIFENAGVAIITTDTEGIITAFNGGAEKMLGYKAEELVGKQTPAILHKSEEVVQRAQEFSRKLGEVVEPGFKVFVIKTDQRLPNAHEWTYICKDGSEVPVYLNVTALYDIDGRTSGYIGIASDVSLFKEAEKQMLIAKEAAESSAQIKSEFLATMSHEIRTPMNGVLGMLGLLSHSKLDETQRHQVRVASSSANSLLGLINDILDFSKVEAGKMQLELIEFNLREELGEFVEAITFRAKEKGLELTLDTTHLTRTSVITDPGRLRQILTNLVGNAVKFTHRGEILITVMLDEVDDHNGRLRIDVRDSGIGIAANKIDGLFQSFSQADNSTTRKYGGTGLGLAIAKKLCELMNGTIWITSVEHEGSTFHIDVGVGLGEKFALNIPSAEGKSSPQGENPLVSKDYSGTHHDDDAEVTWPANTRILLVEDNPTNQIVAQGMLEMIGLDADIANNGLEALKAMELALKFAPYTIILMDCQMPEMDGYTASIAIREGCAGNLYKEIPIIAMTANAMAGDREKCLIAGMSDYVSKPINLEALRTTLIKWLDGKAAVSKLQADEREPQMMRMETEVQEFEVWDEADALKRLGGKKELLHKIMQSFVNEGPKLTEALKEAIRSSDLPSIQLHSHSIKGSAGNVSAQHLKALAKTMEFAAKNGDESVLQEGYVNLEKAMRDVCTLFEKELTQEAKTVVRKKRLDLLQMAIKLQNLKKEIENGSFIETDALNIFGEYTDEAFTMQMKTLKSHIDRFDASEALALLETIMAGLE